MQKRFLFAIVVVVALGMAFAGKDGQLWAQTTTGAASHRSSAAATATSVEMQRDLDRTGPPLTYGTATSILQIPAAGFMTTGVNSVIEDTNMYAYVTATDGNAKRLWAPVYLPGGAQIRWLDLHYYDSDASNNVSAILFMNSGDSAPTVSDLGTVSSSGSSGYGYAAFMLSPMPTYDMHNQYEVYIYGLSTDATIKFKGVDIWYQLQISPAPATATFVDVPTSHWAFQYVEALKASGITTGCDATHFCPNGNVSRAEMAVFLARALGLHWGA